MVGADRCGEGSGISRKACGNKLEDGLYCGVSCGGVPYIVPGNNVALALGGLAYVVQLH